MRNLLLIIAFGLLFSVNDSYSCPSGFTYGGVKTLQLTPDCYMEYEYCWRTLGSFYDMWIGPVSFIGDCNYYVNDFDNDPEKYRRLAMEQVIIEDDPWGIAGSIPICPDLSDMYWRLGTATCYAKEWTIVWVPDPAHPAGGYWKRTKELCELEPYEWHRCWATMQLCWEWVEGEWRLKFTANDPASYIDCADPENCEPSCK